MNRSFLIFLMLLISFSLFSIEETSILNFTKKNYKAASQNWSVVLDNSNIAYFGNGIGLLEFDGVSWELHLSAHISTVRAVAVNNKNRVFTAGYRELGYWERDNFNKLYYTSLTHLVDSLFSSNEEFWNILIQDDKVLFQSFSGIYIYQSDAFQVIKPGGFINYTTKIDGEIFFAVHNEGIYTINNDQVVPFIKAPFFKEKNIRFILKDKKEEHFIIGTESHGMYIYHPVNGAIEAYAPKLANYLNQHKINHGLLTSSGLIIIGTILAGIIAINSAHDIVFSANRDKGLQSNTVLGIDEDSEGNIWLALDRGIDFLSLSETKNYEIIPNDELGAVYTAALYNGSLYLGTNQGLYKRPWPDSDAKFTLLPNTQTQVWDCKIINNQLVVGHNAGTFLITDSVIHMISEQAGGYNIIQHLSQQEKLIQSTYAHLELFSFEDGNWRFTRTIEGFLNLIRFIEFDHQNNLWATHLYNGIYKLNLNNRLDSVISVKQYDILQDNKNHKVNSAVFLVEGRVVFTSGKKLYTYNDLIDSIVPYDYLNKELKSLASSHRIIKVKDHHYWFISQNEIGYYKIYSNEIHKLKVYPTSLFQNLLIPNYENLIQLSDDKALVCLENGYALLNLSSKKEEDPIIKYTPWIKHIQIQNKNEKTKKLPSLSSYIRMPFSYNSLKVQYAFPLLNDEPLEFYYKISGLQEQWSKPSNLTTLEINRIPPGEYLLSVKMTNLWNNSSQIHHLKIKVDLPWYQSYLALVSYTIVLIIISYFLRRVTVRKVQLKESHIREEKEKEIIKLRNENLKSELAFKSQQLASSTMSIIKKNEFLLGLRRRIKTQKEQLGTRYPDKYYQDLILKIDENISDNDDWKIFDANFQQAHKGFVSDMKNKYPELTPNDLRLCAFLRINLTSKEIAPLLGISVRGVENHRYRLRKKLGLTSDENLTDYILMK